MKIAITGGTGLIGQAVTKELISKDHHVLILTRNKENKKSKYGITYVEWLKDGTYPEKELEGIDGLINLAGENLNSGRWTADKKKEILQSRIVATREVVRIIEQLKKKPDVLVNGSAVGFYGTSFTQTFTEKETTPGNDFLADVVAKWENEALKAAPTVRVVCARFGLVLSVEDGALKKMLPPFRLGAGGKLGTGEQWMSWIHISDVARALAHSLTTPSLQGPVNITAPHPQMMKHFGQQLAAVLNRPFWAPVPSSLLKFILGDMSILILEGQRVLPAKLEQHDFRFQFPHLQDALTDLIKK
ncbi:TIGR01777 family protein [Salipaludibacillus agaradhaerens]|uniref:TIGR01777 family oxidoreductase n=1 Tax=Salipaludibacillus agaradhaerens TaxID=76935 RepID=UPI002151445F|nr:TIGR01777 family oxidoreductase [Salipaludibacillus agaradhaerens]MCR6105954.1 TIGR01777 family protein [Salipaludibacillus agaradhaerens]MCR6117987.1 TIGR01777 family protein [Salipaludibacillus agaradhaerens]